MAAALLSWLERRASDRKVVGSMPVLGITSLYPWERYLMLISLQALCVVWKDSLGVCFTTAYTPKKNKKQADLVLLVSPKVCLGNNCPMLNV